MSEIVFKNGDLLDKLKVINAFSRSKSKDPSFMSVLLEQKDGNLNVSYFNDVSKTIIEVELIESSLLEKPSFINLNKLLSILKSYPNQVMVTMSFDEKAIKISCKQDDIKASYELYYKDMEVISDIDDDIKYEISFKISSEVLHKILKKIVICASSEEVRFSVNSVLFNKIDDSMHFVSTDGKRLALYKYTDKSFKKLKDTKIVVTRETILNVLKMVAGTNDTVSIDTAENFIKFKNSDYTIVASIIDKSTYPKYEDIIPSDENFDRKIIMDKGMVTACVQSVSSILSNKNERIELSINKNVMKIYAKDDVFGESEDEMFIDYTGKDFKTAFNYKYMLDALTNIDSFDILMNCSSKALPVMLREKNTDKTIDNLLYIIMPMRLAD